MLYMLVFFGTEIELFSSIHGGFLGDRDERLL